MNIFRVSMEKNASVEVCIGKNVLGKCETLRAHEPIGECLHSFFKFSQTFTGVSIKQLEYELENSI